MKTFSYAFLFIIGFLACKSDTNQLTPEKASALINAHYQGQVVYETFPLTQGGAFTEAVRTKFVELQNAGLITFTEAPYGDGTSEFTATLTDKGKQFVLEDRGQEVIVKHADMALDQIKSIELAENGLSALVKYTWKRYNVTQFGILNGMQESTLDAEDKFIYTGDAWRLQSSYIPKRF